MITASDVAKIIAEDDPRIDVFIEQVLTPKFMQLGKTITVLSKTVSDYFQNEISQQRFQRQMAKRGFSVRYDCDDRPCGDCVYTIEIPPQDI